MSGEVPQSPFHSILNFRDIGKTINLLIGKQILQEGKLFRSARPDDSSYEEKDALKSIYKIRSIIDLRSKSEHIAQSQKHASKSASSGAAVPQSNAAAASSLKISNITYHAISLNGSTFERALLWKLSWPSMTKLIYHMAVGQRTQGISMLGSEVMAPRGLIGLGYDSIDHCGAELYKIFTILASSATYPVLVHCTQGKDRTGLIILIILLICGVPSSAIKADYLASERELLTEREERLKDITAIGLGEEFAGCPEDFVERIEEYIIEKYGGVDTYMKRIKVDEGMRENVKRQVMTQNREEEVK